MKKLSIRLSILAAILMAAGSASAAPVVLNGSFESPDISGGTTSNGGTSWTASGPAVFIVDNVSGLGTTPYGSQYLAMNSGYSDSQAITGFQLGSIYTFSVYFADLLNGPSPSLTVTLSGLVSLSQTFTAPTGGGYGTNAIPFTHVLLTLPALTANGTITLTLTNSSNPTGTIAVDNVSVVPEPSSVVAAFLGLGAVGCAISKRRAKLKC